MIEKWSTITLKQPRGARVMTSSALLRHPPLVPLFLLNLPSLSLSSLLPSSILLAPLPLSSLLRRIQGTHCRGGWKCGDRCWDEGSHTHPPRLICLCLLPFFQAELHYLPPASLHPFDAPACAPPPSIVLSASTRTD